MRKKQATGDALDIIYAEFYGGDANHADLEEARLNLRIAREIRRLRKAAGLTQRELALRADTTHTVICQLEDDDYEGHSLTMLKRVAAALGKDLDVRFLTTGERSAEPVRRLSVPTWQVAKPKEAARSFQDAGNAVMTVRDVRSVQNVSHTSVAARGGGEATTSASFSVPRVLVAA